MSALPQSCEEMRPSSQTVEEWLAILMSPESLVPLSVADGLEPQEGAALVRYAAIGRDADRAPHGWAGRAELPSPDTQAQVPIVISFFTSNTPYEAEADRLRETCVEAGVDHVIDGIPARGSWEWNCAAKAEFCQQMHRQLRRPILWVDADATLERRPGLLARCPADFGVHKWAGREFASGTLFFNQTPLAEELLRAWVARCAARPDVWDQKLLEAAWHDVASRHPISTLWLPRSYVRIFDAAPVAGESPVIVHHQASRRLKSVVTTNVDGNAAMHVAPVRSHSLSSDVEDVRKQIAAEREAVSGCLESADNECRRIRHAIYQSRLEPLIHILREANVRDLLIYGSGEVGGALVDLCRAARVSVRAFVETHGDGHGTAHGLPVIAPSAAAAGDCHTYAIASFGSAPAILGALETAYRGSLFTYQAFTAPGPAPFVPNLQSMAGPLLTYQEGLSQGRTLADLVWLESNRAERMDARLSMFRPSRRDFHLARYQFAVAWTPNRRVLDCASGTGYGAHLLKIEGRADSVLGVDCAPDAIAYSRRYYQAEGIAWECMSADAIRAPRRRFDLITSFETIEHVPDDVALLEAFAAVLTDDGVCMISTPDAWPIDASPHHVRTYDRATFLRLLRRHFADVTMYGQWSSDVREHAGIELLARTDNRQAECLIAVCQRPLRR